MEPSEIESLTERAAQGDREALEVLLTTFLPSLRAFIRSRLGRVVGERESSSDIAQSVCREVLEQGDTFRHPSEGAFKRWLFRMALRKLSRRRDFLLAERRDVLREEPSEGQESQLLDAFRTFSTPSRGAQASEETERIEGALNGLSEEHRTVIVLAHVMGLSRAEIGEELEKSETAVRMLLYRAPRSTSAPSTSHSGVGGS